MRKKKISGDISELANDLLNAACVKHSRSKGYLLDRMIIKCCTDELPTKKEPVKKEPVKRFKKPTVEEVFNYCNERCNKINAEAFVDHYEANGWVQGKGKPVKDWKACIRTWEKNDSGKQNSLGKTSGNLSACEDFING